MLRYLIIAPRFSENWGEFNEFPIGLGYISSSLKQAGFDVSCLNLNLHKESLKALLRARMSDIDVVCTGGLAPFYHKIKEIIDTANELKPGIKTIIGGGLITSEPELIYNDLKPTVGVLGEGEETIVELAGYLERPEMWPSIKGIIYESGGKIVITGSRPPLKDLDALPYPDYDGFGLDAYLDHQLPQDAYFLYPFDKPRYVSIFLSRSCPFRCTYCFHPLGNSYRKRSFDGFFKEVDYLVNTYHINMLSISDEFFSGENLEEFCERIKTYNLKWITQTRIDAMSEEKLKMMKDSGCFYLGYGLESAHNDILKSFKKHSTVEQMEKILEMTALQKIGIQGNFLFFDRAETVETTVATLEWWLAHYQYHIHFATLRPYPGTELYQYCLEKGVIKDRLQYIKDCCPPVNMTRFDSTGYSMLQDMVNKYLHSRRMFCDVLSYRKTGFDEFKDVSLFELSLRCPHCGDVSVYKNVHFRELIYKAKMCCKQCNQRFDINVTAGLHTQHETHGNNLTREIYTRRA